MAALIRIAHHKVWNTYHIPVLWSSDMTHRCWHSQLHTSATGNNAASKEQQDVKPFSAIPGPKGWPVIGNMFEAMRGGAMSGQLHKYFAKQHKKYGPIFKEHVGPGYKAVQIMDPADVEQIFRHEGKYPRRTAFTPFLLYRKESGKPLGLLIRYL